jgi:hypothetical protein
MLGTLTLRFRSFLFAFQLLLHQEPTPPMRSFKVSILLSLASALVVCAVKNITVDDFDPRIVYSPTGWLHENVGCPPPTPLASADLWVS